MMKKVLFALAVLCTSFWSCNTLDLNDVGYGDGDRLKASSVKEILRMAVRIASILVFNRYYLDRKIIDTIQYQAIITDKIAGSVTDGLIIQ